MKKTKKIFKNLILLILVFVVISEYGCRKVEDENAPKITITSPLEDHQFQIPDTIRVIATIEDESEIQSISVKLTDMNMVPVTSAVAIESKGSIVDIDIPFEVDNKYISSGTYYLTIEASDGVNEERESVKIYLYEYPRKFLYPIVVTEKGNNKLGIHYIDTVYTENHLFDVSSDYSGSDISSRYQQLYISGSVYGDLNTFDLKTNLKAWDIPKNNTPPLPWFETVCYHDQLIYAASYDGSIKAYNSSGSQKWATNAKSNSYATKLFFHEDYMITSEDVNSVTNGQIGVYFAESGGNRQYHAKDFEVVGFFSRNDNEIYIFANKNGEGKIYIYDINNNSLWEPYPYQIDQINDVCKIASDVYLLATFNGIKKYQYSPISITDFDPGISARKIVRQDLSNIMYVVDNNNWIHIYNYPNPTSLTFLYCNGPVLDIHLLYNK